MPDRQKTEMNRWTESMANGEQICIRDASGRVLGGIVNKIEREAGGGKTFIVHFDNEGKVFVRF